jgi:hypothetical protein
MRKIISLSVALMFLATVANAQTTAMQLSGPDCNGNIHDLYADLDSGKAVLLHFFMPNCGSCPPPAQTIQAMADNILATYPGMITGYALPFNNTTDCHYTANWTSGNNLPLYMPYDSGATQVAHYGGFGMPTVVLLGGADHRVMFSTQSFSASDTTIMRDSILALLTPPVTDVALFPEAVSFFSVFPNPANGSVSVNITLNEPAALFVDMTDISGKQVEIIMDEDHSQTITKQFSTASLPSGVYFVRLQVNGSTTLQKLSITH